MFSYDLRVLWYGFKTSLCMICVCVSTLIEGFRRICICVGFDFCMLYVLYSIVYD